MKNKTLKFGREVTVISSASAVGEKEKKGPIGDCFDIHDDTDRFGKNTMLIPDGEEYFNFTVKVAISPMFLSWVIGFGAKAKILYPQSVVDACKELCMEAMSQY